MTSLPFTRPPFLSFYKTVRSPKKFHPTQNPRTDLLSACGNAGRNRELSIPGLRNRCKKANPETTKAPLQRCYFYGSKRLRLV
jgi:hypothetical protein